MIKKKIVILNGRSPLNEAICRFHCKVIEAQHVSTCFQIVNKSLLIFVYTNIQLGYKCEHVFFVCFISTNNRLFIIYMYKWIFFFAISVIWAQPSLTLDATLDFFPRLFCNYWTFVQSICYCEIGCEWVGISL